ncbi:MAG: MlaA family lipoprotein [Candidatus Gastranaerophilales bacterium]|nr:MlaA family lipoprotein [Candidatus Gastranaerophilales bacterium]
MFKKKIALVLMLTYLMSGCLDLAMAAESTTKYPDYAKAFSGEDKFENYNRKMYQFNTNINKFILKPINIVWASIMPKYGIERIKNVYTNIEYPKRAVSCLLQKDFSGVKDETYRFLLNSTIGLGGLYDPAKSKFKIEPQQDSMEQVLSKCKIPQGPYIVLPCVPPSNVRGYVGKVLDYALTPSTYTFGLVPMIVKAGFMANRTTCAQSLLSGLEGNFADPYDIAKKLSGIDNYIKNENLDKKEVIGQIVEGQSIPKSEPFENELIEPDMKLADYAPQNPIVDSLRTSFFESDVKKSMWSDMSVWNQSFNKKVKYDSVKLYEGKTPYKFRYILQKDKSAPIAVFYPSIGEGASSHHSVVFAKMFYDLGYSVVIQGSAFQWEFVKSSPTDYRPGNPYKDAQLVRLVTNEIFNKLTKENNITPKDKIIVGTSFGAMTTLFVGAQEHEKDTLGVTKYIAISPPIDLLFAMKELDKNAAEWNINDENVKERAAIVASKIMQVTKAMTDNDPNNDPKELPFTTEEGKFTIDFIMKQKLSDVIYTIENENRSKKTAIYNKINDMNFNDYLQNYLVSSLEDKNTPLEKQLHMSSISDFLTKSNNYKIYEAKNDYFTSVDQISWLKDITGEKTVILENGSHLGYLYRNEFQSSLKDTIAIENLHNTPELVKAESKQAMNEEDSKLETVK